ncbi:MAG TPA: PAS domain S-box protein, partial [Gammaproteobacteria bacterium]|nr:PAS domain S-box protein [Gammaproteobacteria bacterium]
MDDTARLGWERQAQLMDYLLNHSPDAIIGVDEENRVRVFNQRAEETFGYSFRDLEGQPLSRILPNFPLTAGRTLPTEDAWHNGGENSGAQGMWAFGQRKDGTRVTVEVCPSCLQAENDSLLVLQTRATTDSQKAWRRLERIVDGLRNIPEIVWIADSKGMDHFRETEIP